MVIKVVLNQMDHSITLLKTCQGLSDFALAYHASISDGGIITPKLNPEAQKVHQTVLGEISLKLHNAKVKYMKGKKHQQKGLKKTGSGLLGAL